MSGPPDLAARRERGLALARAWNEGNHPELGVAVLGTFNLDLLPPLLTEALERAGLSGQVVTAPFGQLAQQILASDSELYRTSPDQVVLVPATEDLVPRPDAALVEERLGELRQLVTLLLERLPGSSVYAVAFGADHAHAEHVLDPLAPERGQAALARFDEGIRELSTLSPRVVVVDWDWRARSAGRDSFRDPRLWYLARMRLSPLGLAALADLLAEHIAAVRSASRKVVTFDLDDVLWGGIVGEVGLSGIELGEDGIGLAFQDVQRELLKLRDAGVLLTACSKNNEADALEVFERHPGMVLRREHLAAHRINWQDKATNLQMLADELGLGLDSFVFLDDSPFERDWVRTALPEVLVPELPADAVERPDFLRRAPYFRRLSVTAADAARADGYRREGLRRELKAHAASLDEFVATLEQRVTIERVHEGTLGRAAQLTQRTSQFNLTTRRYTIGELEALTAGPDVEIYTLALADRFGDSGITGLAILRFAGAEVEIDTLLLSCRVLGRRVEDVFLSFLAGRALQRGATWLVGRYLPTPKNDQVEPFYAERGFDSLGDGLFRLELERGRIEAPAGIALHATADA